MTENHKESRQSRVPPSTRVLQAVFVLAALVRLVYVWELSHNDPFFDRLAKGFDSATYWQQATTIAHGDVLLRTDGPYYYGPLYSYFLAMLFRCVGQSFWAVHACQAVLGALSCALLAAAAMMVFNRAAGLIAGVLAAFSPTLLYYEQRILMEGLLFFLLSAALVFFLLMRAVGARRERYLWAVLTGLFVGLAASGRSTHVLTACVFALMVLWTRREPLRRRLLPAALILGLAAVPPGLLVLRNGLMFGRWAPTTNGPVNLYIGNAPDAFGLYTPPRSLEELNAKHGGHPSDKALLDALAGGLRRYPVRVLRLELRKLHFWFSVWDIPNNYSFGLVKRYSVFTRWSPSSYWVLFPMGLVGLGLACVRRRSARLWTGLLAAMTVGGVVCFVLGRLKLPLLLVMIPCSGYLVDVLRRSLRRPERIAACVAAATLLVFLLQPGVPMRIPPGLYYTTAMMEARRGDRDKAIDLLQEASLTYPHDRRLRAELERLRGR